MLRNRDANTAWTSASDGTLEERIYYCQNWRADVVALVTAAGGQVEQVRYSAYGVPFGLPAGDCNSDGTCNSADETLVSAWIGVTYDPRADCNLDGLVDNSDLGAIQSSLTGVTLGRMELSRLLTNSRRGYAGGVWDGHGHYDVRVRALSVERGRWNGRDPMHYDPSGLGGGMNLYEYVLSSPLILVDPTGGVPQGVGVQGPVGAGAASCLECHFPSTVGYAGASYNSRMYANGTTLERMKDDAYDATMAFLAGHSMFGYYPSWVTDLNPQAQSYLGSMEARYGTGADILRDAATGYGVGLVVGAIYAPRATVTLYRAVSHAEYRQIMATQTFQQGPNSLAVKWFAESAAHAAEWGRRMQAQNQFRIVAVRLKKSFADTLQRVEKLDGIGPARVAETLSELKGLAEGVIRKIL